MDTEQSNSELVEKLVKRREFLNAHKTPCPNCGSKMVRLANWLCVPAKWDCHDCKMVFVNDGPIIKEDVQ